MLILAVNVLAVNRPLSLYVYSVKKFVLHSKWCEKVAYTPYTASYTRSPCLSRFTDMIARVEFFHDWIANGKPFAYWISSMYFPQGFLTSVLQAYARSNMVPVDVRGAVTFREFS